MYLLKYLKNGRVINEEEFSTIEEIEEKHNNGNYFEEADEFEIVDSNTGDTISGDEIVNPDDIIEDMFDGEDSMEGFDWNQDD
ncbi:hypothetical protein [Chitinophaga sancti]|uniref:Uncharacterized protein n=1 Tax=Chitinophaga sancti TaxID=1004 RepID=A0A1K1T4E1_9BACT|nr:hypothetical protein [Chitinophaga sancti]WQD61426.1 hypothetical protein U0033_26475 [Chitinophaga sancti]WQG93021.1 hypothetical protein SR876_15985 [Chitinophaga sancti]SFW91215.1 hypothetical protein SAMN05661012_06749 [Chitinophaga sancti]